MCMNRDDHYDEPVAWLGIATDRASITTSRYDGVIDRPLRQPWKEGEVYKVYLMTDCGEGAFMEAIDLLQEYIDNEPWRELK